MSVETKPAELLDLALVCMGLGDVGSLFPEMEEIHVPRSMFDGAQILHPDLDDLIGDRQEVFSDARHKDLSGPLDVKLLTTASVKGEVQPLEDEFALQRVRRVSPQAVRGATSLVTPNMVEWSGAFIRPRLAKVETVRSYWGEVKPFHWQRIDTFPWGDRAWLEPSDAFPGFNNAEVHINFAHGFAFTARYQWQVYLGTPRFPGITIPTTPSAALEVFRLREAPEEGRRAALRHWVRQHVRSGPSDQSDAEEVLVREHLRGSTEFRWNGLTCKITPSAFDLDRNERLKREAAVRRKR